MNGHHAGAATNWRPEWRSFWFLPLVAALGYSVSVLPIYAMGPFMAPLEQAFGWSRAQISFGATIFSIISALTTLITGTVVDRVGPRRIALLGVPLGTAAVALLGAASGSIANWMLLWVAVSICSVTTQATVWTSAVVSRFEASRGVALAITLSGGSFATAVLPVLATLLIQAFGWRGAFFGIGVIWVVVVYPLTLLLFRGAQDGGPRQRAQPISSASLPGLTLAEAMRRSAFYKLTLAGALFAFCVVGVAVHFVPILVKAGSSPIAAAGAASLIGIFAIGGRLCTGVVLDRFPAHFVGAVAFLIPVPGCAILWTGGGGLGGEYLAAALFGLALGAEIDLVAFLASRLFGQKNFGAILGAMLSLLGLGAGIGPLAAGATYDHFGGYAPFILLAGVLMLVGAGLMGSLGRAPSQAA